MHILFGHDENIFRTMPEAPGKCWWIDQHQNRYRVADNGGKSHVGHNKGKQCKDHCPGPVGQFIREYLYKSFSAAGYQPIEVFKQAKVMVTARITRPALPR